MRLRRWAAAFAGALLCVGFFSPPSLAVGLNPQFKGVAVTRMTGLNGRYIRMVNARWPWAHYGFMRWGGWAKPCGQRVRDDWGCWIYARTMQSHWTYLGYDGWHVTRRWESYRVHAEQAYTAYHMVKVWEVIQPAYTTTAYKQVYVPHTGWLTITQNVWESSPTAPAKPTRWYFIAVPQWMVNWGYNPAALDGTPNPGRIAPGPTSPGAHNGGKMVTETTRYWTTWSTPKTVSYLVHHAAQSGWVAVRQAYTAYRWIWVTHWHWVTSRYWGPMFGWVWSYPPGSNATGWGCRHWYSLSTCQ